MGSGSGLQAACVGPRGARPLKPMALPPAPPLPQAGPAGLLPASSLRLAHSFWNGLPVKSPAPEPHSPALPEPCRGRGRGDVPSHTAKVLQIYLLTRFPSETPVTHVLGHWMLSFRKLMIFFIKKKLFVPFSFWVNCLTVSSRSPVFSSAVSNLLLIPAGIFFCLSHC